MTIRIQFGFGESKVGESTENINGKWKLRFLLLKLCPERIFYAKSSISIQLICWMMKIRDAGMWQKPAMNGIQGSCKPCIWRCCSHCNSHRPWLLATCPFPGAASRWDRGKGWSAVSRVFGHAECAHSNSVCIHSSDPLCQWLWPHCLGLLSEKRVGVSKLSSFIWGSVDLLTLVTPAMGSWPRLS